MTKQQTTCSNRAPSTQIAPSSVQVGVLPATRGAPARACPHVPFVPRMCLQEGHLHRGQRAGEQQSPTRLSFLEKLTWPIKPPIKAETDTAGRGEWGKGLLERFKKGGERKYKGFFPQINFQEGPALSRTPGGLRTGVTAEKSFFGVGFGCVFLFPSEGSLATNHTVLHLPSKYATSPLITASVQRRFAESGVHR